MGQTLDISGSQINGARDYQEDAFLIVNLGDTGDTQNAGSLVIVADGMGGHAAGNVAANMAVQTFNKFVTAHYPTHAIPAMLQEAVRAANASINETVRETPALRGMGCTLVAALFNGSKLYWVSVGDSHLYLLRNHELTKKNVCHSYGGFLDRMAAAGRPIEPEAGFSRNMLMSALSGDEIAEIDCPDQPLELQAGDRIVVCSDGLDSINSAKILSFSQSAKTAKEFVGAMLKGVEDAAIPRQDNTTAVVVDMPGRIDKPATVSPPILRTVVAEPPASMVALAAAPQAVRNSTASAVAPAREERKKPRRDMRDAYVRPSPLPKLLLVVVLAGAGAAGYLYREQLLSNPIVASLLETFALNEIFTPSVPVPPEPPEAPTGPTGTTEPTVETPPVEPTPAPVEPEQVAIAEPMPPPGPIEEFTDGPGPVMVWVPGGSFEMGSSSAWPDLTERPRHKVTLNRFAISRREITIAEYSRFREAPNPFGQEAATHPVNSISWEDAVAYTRWLSEQTGKKYRLATEAEWEYAAAAGSDPQYWPWGRTEKPEMAHCFRCAPGLEPTKPAPVASFSANAFGVFDTAGNVAEWVQDCYIDSYQDAPTDGSARNDPKPDASGNKPPECQERVVRGGSFETPPKSIRSASRDRWTASKGHERIGFRIVREE
jgi:formylglycine-generating enzyme required for sulfatase activity/serine/threonine protein phosphatase PrpC